MSSTTIPGANQLAPSVQHCGVLVAHNSHVWTNPLYMGSRECPGTVTCSCGHASANATSKPLAAST